MSKKFYSLFLTLLTAFLWLGTGTAWGDELTVANGTDQNDYVPYYAYYGNNYNHVQIIYPASDLGEMDGTEISSMKFYSTTTSATGWGAARFDIRLMHTTLTSLTGTVDVSEATKVLTSGILSVAADGTMTVNFDDAFVYDGTKSLLFDLQSTKGSYSNRVYFLGQNVTGASYQGNSSSTTFSLYAKNFRPKTTFTYESASLCKKPNLTRTGKTATTASFSWTAGESGENTWEYLYLPAATTITPEHWESAIETTSTSVTISGLTELASYKFYLRAVCGGTDGKSGASVDEFTTDCAKKSLPWEEGFESYSAGSVTNVGLNECWDVLNDAASSGSYPQVYVTNESTWKQTGNRGLYFMSSSSNYVYVILPEFEHTIDVLKIKFSYKMESGASGRTITLGYMTDPANESTFHEVKVCSHTTSWTEIKDQVFSSVATEEIPNARIAFRYGKASNNYYMGLDDIKVELNMDCSKPATPTYSDLTSSSVTINWAANAGVTDYKYINVDRTANPTYVLDWENDATAISATSVGLTSLTDGHNYEFYVMCACGTVASDACEYTPLSCPAVTGVALSNQVWNGVTVNWTTSATTNCDVQYKIGEGIWTEYESNISATSKSFSGLVPGTEYSFRVKPHCSADGWVSPALPYTPVCPTPSALTLSEETYNSVKVSWDAIDGVNTWNLAYKSADDLGWTNVNGITDLFYTIPGMTTNSEYTIQLSTECGGEPYSETTYTPVYAAPTSVLVSAQDLGGDASWAPVEGATGYQYIVVLKDAAQDWSTPATGTTVSSGYVHADPVLSGLHAKTAYDFYVKAVFAGGTSAATKKSFTTSSHAPNTPTVADGDITSSSAVATWTLPAACQATQCQWICKLTSAGAPAVDDAAWSAPTTEFTANISGLDAYTDYTVYVRAYYENGIYSSNATKAFKTKCGTETLPFSYDFGNNGTLSPCWKNNDYSGSYYWTLSDNYTWSSTEGYNYYAGFQSRGSSGVAYGVLETPSIDLSDEAILTFR